METFAFVAELISTISVIASLIYLAFSIRENTRSMRRTAGRELLRDMNDLSRYFIQDQDLTELYLASIEKPQDLTPAERFRIERLLNYVFTSFQSALDYHKDKLIDNEAVITYAQAIRPLFDQPVVGEWWEREGQYTLGQDFRDTVLKRGSI
jgi:hypothetical protein